MSSYPAQFRHALIAVWCLALVSSMTVVLRAADTLQALALPDPALSTLRSAADTRSIPDSNRDLVYPVEIPAVVLFHAPETETLWIWDGAETFLLHAPVSAIPDWLLGDSPLTLRGSYVKSEGFTTVRIALHQGSAIPRPTPRDIAPLLAEPQKLRALHERLVSVEGLVRSTRPQDETRLLVELLCENHLVSVLVNFETDADPSWTGERVRITGLLQIDPEFSDKSGSYVVRAFRDNVKVLAAYASGSDQPPLRRGREAWNLRDEARGIAHPIDIPGVVVHYDRAWQSLWVWDGEHAIFIAADLANTPAWLVTGASTTLRGEVIINEGFTSKRIRFEPGSSQSMPTPVLGNLLLANPNGIESLMSRLTTLEGLIEAQQKVDDTHLQVNLVCDGHKVTTLVVVEPGQNPSWTGSFVRVTGLFLADRRNNDGSRRLGLNAVRENIVVTGALADDPRFNRSVIPTDDIEVTFTADWLRVVGTVHSQVLGKHIILRDESGQLRVQAPYLTSYSEGLRIEAIGRRATDEGGVFLGEAVCRVLTDQTPPPPPPVLRLARLIQEIGNVRAGDSIPVRLRGRAVYVSPDGDWFYLQDASGAVRVELPAGAPKPNTASVWEIVGTTISGPFSPRVRADSWVAPERIITPPAVQAVTLNEALTGLYEGRQVEIDAYVRASSQTGPIRDFELVTASGRFTASCIGHYLLDHLVGSVVRLRGICEAVPDSRGQLSGIRLLIENYTDISVLEPAPADLFSRRYFSVPDVKRFGAIERPYRLVGVRGPVTYHTPGEFLVVQEGDHTLRILTAESPALAPGEIIEAVGLPGWEGNELFLHEALFRRVGRREPPTPLLEPSLDLADNSYDYRLVGKSGELLQIVSHASRKLLVLRQPTTGRLFEAHAPAILSPTPELGSTLLVTGISAPLRSNDAVAQVPRILLRSAADITTLARPSWWTADRLLGISLTLALGAALSLAWIGALRRRVSRQTAQIREQIATEARLEHRHRAIVENASDAILTCDLGGRITSLNHAGELLTGHDAASAAALRLADLLVPADTPLPDLSSLPTGTVAFPCQLRTRQGALVWVEIHACLLREEGRPAAILALARDITAHKQAQAALAAARDAAEANAAARGAFLANMSHEIRTPMNGVIGMAHLLLDTPLNPEQHSFALTIRDSAEALLVILNDILDFSKIEAGKLHLECIDFDLAEVVASTLDLLGGRAADKNLELVCLLPPDAPRHLRGDPGRLRQVLLNLVGNAVKFTAEGEVGFEVSVLEDGADRARYRFEIKDTGPGLTPEALSRLFQPFEQADTSTTRKFGGTGLGLAICKQIVELMGGEIGAHSRPDRGAIFWFTLELKKRSAVPVAADASPPSRLAGKHVLIVESNASQRDALARYFAAFGARTSLAVDADSALSALSPRPDAPRPAPDMVLISHQSSILDAFALARHIRSSPDTRSLRLLLAQPLTRRPEPAALREAGFDAHLPKPVHPDALLAAVEQAETARSGLPEPRASVPVASTPLLPDRAVRILLVEDNPGNQRVARLQLQRFGCVVDIAGNGLEAVAAVAAAPYDLILMDCQMPELDGYEATRRIRAGDHQPRIKIIAAHLT